MGKVGIDPNCENAFPYQRFKKIGGCAPRPRFACSLHSRLAGAQATRKSDIFTTEIGLVRKQHTCPLFDTSLPYEEVCNTEVQQPHNPRMRLQGRACMIWQLQASQSISQCLTLGTFVWFRTVALHCPPIDRYQTNHSGGDVLGLFKLVLCVRWGSCTVSSLLRSA